jgi:hypothetical protein
MVAIAADSLECMQFKDNIDKALAKFRADEIEMTIDFVDPFVARIFAASER